LDLMILQTLQWGPQHGYGISLAIRNRSGEILQVDTGSLYPALHRLEKQKWEASEWKVSENKQRAKYYRPTSAGKRQRAHERSRGRQLHGDRRRAGPRRKRERAMNSGWFSRKRRCEELNDELRSHLDMATEDRVQRGESPVAAAHVARSELGNFLLIRE